MKLRRKNRSTIDVDSYDLIRLGRALDVLTKLEAGQGVRVRGLLSLDGRVLGVVSYDSTEEDYVIEWNR